MRTKINFNGLNVWIRENPLTALKMMSRLNDDVSCCHFTPHHITCSIYHSYLLSSLSPTKQRIKDVHGVFSKTRYSRSHPPFNLLHQTHSQVRWYAHFLAFNSISWFTRIRKQPALIYQIYLIPYVCRSWFTNFWFFFMNCLHIWSSYFFFSSWTTFRILLFPVWFK